MFEDIMNVHSMEDFDNLSVKLLDADSYRQLQEEMVAKDVALSRKDYWTADTLRRMTANAAATRKAVEEVSKENAEKKILHLMQIVTVAVPGAPPVRSAF